MIKSRKNIAKVASLVAVGSGSLNALRRYRSNRGDHRVSILAYHDICSRNGGEREGTISADRLRAHLLYVRDNFRMATLAECARALSGETALDEDLLAVTFDDGYRSNHELAWPVLRELEIPATIFVTTGFLDGGSLWFDVARRGLERMLASGRALEPEAAKALRAALGETAAAADVGALLGELKYIDPAVRAALVSCLHAHAADAGTAAQPLDWDAVRELAAGGIEIGCHTVSHPILSQLGAEEQRAEIEQARDRIAEEIGHAPTSFAYPNGSVRDYDDDTLAALREAGFTVAVTTARGANRPGCDMFQLRRTSIGSDPNFVLAARLAGLFDEGLRSLLPEKLQHVH